MNICRVVNRYGNINKLSVEAAKGTGRSGRFWREGFLHRGGALEGEPPTVHPAVPLEM